MKNLYVLTVMLIVLGIFSCDPDYDCVENDTLPEFDDLVQVDSVAYPNIINTRAALDSFYYNQPLIINSDSAYILLQQREASAAVPCSNCNFPNINFSTYTLLGFLFRANCQEINYSKVVKNTDGSFTYYFKSNNFQQCASSSCPVDQFNWVLVPKIPEGTLINFEQGRFRYDCEC